MDVNLINVDVLINVVVIAWRDGVWVGRKKVEGSVTDEVESVIGIFRINGILIVFVGVNGVLVTASIVGNFVNWRNGVNCFMVKALDLVLGTVVGTV